MSQPDAGPAAPSLPPFACSFTPEVPDILHRLGCTLALTTYQAGKVIFMSPGEDNLVQLARNFRRPMGLVVDEGRMAVATQHEVVVFEDAPALARTYPPKPDTYDALYLPRVRYHTGPLDLHDLAWDDAGRLWAVNTLFSCLSYVDGRSSFTAAWRPPFVRALAPEDRCHLNGLAMADGQPRYVTALGATDAPKAWRHDRLGGGVVVDVATGEVVVHGLAMSHSPRVIEGELYLLAAASGEVLQADPRNGSITVVNRVPGFARGLARYGDYLFVGISKIRKRHVFGDLPVAQRTPRPGVVLLHLPSGRIAGMVQYHTACEEIYDVQVLPGVVRPNVVGVHSPLLAQAIHTPEGGYWAQHPAARAKGERQPASGRPVDEDAARPLLSTSAE